MPTSLSPVSRNKLSVETDVRPRLPGTSIRQLSLLQIFLRSNRSDSYVSHLFWR